MCRTPFDGKEDVDICDTRRANLKRFARKSILGVYLREKTIVIIALIFQRLIGTFLAIIPPPGAFRPTGRYRGMMAHLLREVTVLLVEPDILKRLALRAQSQKEERRM